MLGYVLPTACKCLCRYMVCVYTFHPRADVVFSLFFLSYYAQVRPPLINFLVLPCPQIITARIMTSHLCLLARAISKKKARAYYF